MIRQLRRSKLRNEAGANTLEYSILAAIFVAILIGAGGFLSFAFETGGNRAVSSSKSGISAEANSPFSGEELK